MKLKILTFSVDAYDRSELDELTDEQNLEKFNIWCVEQFKEFEDE